MYFRIFFSMNWCYDPVWEFKTGFKSWSFCKGRVGKKILTQTELGLCTTGLAIHKLENYQ